MPSERDLVALPLTKTGDLQNEKVTVLATGPSCGGSSMKTLPHEGNLAFRSVIASPNPRRYVRLLLPAGDGTTKSPMPHSDGS